jgi:protein-S-isoprenylcysteine O-methyltransferase Ste14
LSDVDIVAAVSIAVCWVAFAVVWLITANYNESRAPAQRQRSWYGTGILPVVAVPAVREGHQLRTSGPYALTRHPIYTGLLGILLGTMLVASSGQWIAPFPVAVILIEFKIRIEERYMTAEFPDEYPRYRQRVPQLVPGLGLLTGHRAAAS